MNARLQDLIVEAEARLGPEAQERLAAVVESFMATWAEPADFTPEEMDHLRTLDREPFVAADPAEVEAFFAQRG